MQIAQRRPLRSQQDQHQSSAVHWQIGSVSPRENEQMSTTMSNRIHHPLIFSIDDRLSEQHLIRLDLCSKNLKKIDKLPNNIDFNVVLFDHNEISKLEHLDILTQLIQLSISHNRLVDIRLISRLRSLQKLNLSHNLIDSIDCLKSLQNLVMINISNNNIQNIATLNTCHALQSLDASDNSIQQIEDLSHLTSLKYLNLHRNLIDTLISAVRHWPKSLHTLVISDNEIQDLTEISYLSSFIELNTLYIIDNPCLSVVNERYGCHQPFDHRPYILNWCLSIHNLDGIFITRKESLKGEWLLSQGKGRSFRPGDHEELVQYLTKVCGTDADKRDDLHLSRIMMQQDMYNQRRLSGDETNFNEQMMTTTDTMKDANDTLSKNTQGRLQQSTLISESEFIKVNTSSSVSTVGDPMASVYQQQMRTPSPGYTRPGNVAATYIDDQITENSSSHRYTNYDNRPMKPLDQNMLRTKLDEYPIDNHTNNRMNDNTNNSRPRASSNPQETSSHLIYNANRYSPKTTTRGPTTSATLHTRSNKNLAKQHLNRGKRRTVMSSNSNALLLRNYPHQNSTHRLTTAVKVKTKQQQSSIGTSNDNRNQHDDDDDDDDDDNDEPKTALIDTMFLTQNTTMNNSVDLQRLTTSVETMRTSVLQAYLDLHERFTKTTELQTSALTALWKKCETESITHQRETEKMIQENRSLNQRIRELEARLYTNEPKSVNQSSNSTNFNPKQNPALYPPLRAHISKRDTKSFFLHWIPNPLNEYRSILGYRIYVDDILKGAIDSGQFEAIIDYIRDEGEYKIKIRAYDDYGESLDSNIVVARFRRQHPITPRSDSNISETATVIQRTQSDYIIEDTSQPQSHENAIISRREQIEVPIYMDKRRIEVEQQQQPNDAPAAQRSYITPEKQTKNSDEFISPITISPYSNHTTTNDNIISRRPPKSPSSSPSRNDKTSTNNGSCSKVLFANNNNDSSTIVTTKRSPTRAGIMSRLAKSPHRMKRNNILLNACPVEITNSPTEPINISKTKAKIVTRTITFQPDFRSRDHGHILAQQASISSTDISNSMNILQSSINFDNLLSHSPPPPPIPPRMARSRNTTMISLDQPS